MVDIGTISLNKLSKPIHWCICWLSAQTMNQSFDGCAIQVSLLYMEDMSFCLTTNSVLPETCVLVVLNSGSPLKKSQESIIINPIIDWFTDVLEILVNQYMAQNQCFFFILLFFCV